MNETHGGNMAAIEPFMNISPGDLIKEELEYYGWTQKDLAGIIGISEKHLSKIINSNTAISNDIAKSLSQIFKQSPEFWLKAEYDYRERLKERNSEANKEEAIRIKAEIYRYMPIQQMIKLGWLSEWKNVDDLVKQVKIFWRKNALDFSLLNNQQIASYNRSSEVFADNFNYYHARVWLQKAHLLSEEIDLPKYNKSDLSAILNKISRYTIESNGVQNIIHDLRQAGTGFLMLNHLPQTYLDGACFFRESNPFMVYTCRYDRIDNFWFLIAHEMAHILYHLNESNTEGIIDEISSENKDKNDIEREADAIAREALKHNDIIQYFENIDKINLSAVSLCARKLEIHPAIITGVLQYNHKIPWNHYLNKHKTKVFSYLNSL